MFGGGGGGGYPRTPPTSVCIASLAAMVNVEKKKHCQKKTSVILGTSCRHNLTTFSCYPLDYHAGPSN